MDELKNLKENLLLFLEETQDETRCFYAGAEDAQFFKISSPKKTPTVFVKSEKISPPPAVIEPVLEKSTPLKPAPPPSRKEEEPPVAVKVEPLHTFEKESPPTLAPLTGIFDPALYTQIAKLVPGFKLREEILNDAPAKEKKNLWQESLKTLHVAILDFGEKGESALFLKNLATAIDSLLLPCRVIEADRFEREKKWNLFFNEAPLTLVIAPEFREWRKSLLVTHFEELPKSCFLTENKKIPALLLQPLFEYLQKPLLKKELWKTLSTHLSS